MRILRAVGAVILLGFSLGCAGGAALSHEEVEREYVCDPRGFYPEGTPAWRICE